MPSGEVFFLNADKPEKRLKSSIGIIGPRGFIGSYLCRYIAAQDSVALRLLARNISGYQAPTGTDVVQGDLSSLADCAGFATDLKLIYYLAHKNTPVDSDVDPSRDTLVNLVPLLNLLQAVQRLGCKPHIVYFSSGGAVYAAKENRIPYRESDTCSPMSSYGIQKLAAEEYLRLAAHKGYLTATVLRVGNAYGTLLSQSRMQGLIGVAINSVAHRQPIRLFGNPNNVRDYIHLEDISRIAISASVPRHEFSVINVGSGVGHSVREVLSLIEGCWAEPIKVVSDPSYGNLLSEWAVLDNSKARAEYGWTPAIDLRFGIAKMLEDAAVEPEFPSRSAAS